MNPTGDFVLLDRGEVKKYRKAKIPAITCLCGRVGLNLNPFRADTIIPSAWTLSE